MPQKKGCKKTPGSGRQKGSTNKIVKEFKDLMNSILFDKPAVTRTKLLQLRDSDEPSDRKTFWSIATKLLPQRIEGKFEIDAPLLILDQDYVKGQTREIEMESDERS